MDLIQKARTYYRVDKPKGTVEAYVEASRTTDYCFKERVESREK